MQTITIMLSLHYLRSFEAGTSVVAADGSRRHFSRGPNAPTDVGGYALSVNRVACEVSGLRSHTQRGVPALRYSPQVVDQKPMQEAAQLSRLGCGWL